MKLGRLIRWIKSKFYRRPSCEDIERYLEERRAWVIDIMKSALEEKEKKKESCDSILKAVISKVM